MVGKCLKKEVSFEGNKAGIRRISFESIVEGVMSNETSVNSVVFDETIYSRVDKYHHNIKLGCSQTMNTQIEFVEPASPLCRPMKFRANQVEKTSKNSQEPRPQPSLSRLIHHPHKCKVEHEHSEGHKQSVLSFLRNHNKGKLRVIETAC